MYMLSVLIPVYNEETILESSVLTVHNYLEERAVIHEIIVANNGSTDGTKNIGERLAQEYPWLHFYTLSERGVGKAFVESVKRAKGEYLLSLDIDLSSELTFIDFAQDLLDYCDMVVGSKTMGNQRRTVMRVLASQMYILFSQVFFQLTISDYSIGCKAYKKSAIVNALSHLDHWTGYVFELCLFLRLRGKRVLQVGIDCDDTRKSHFSLLHEGVYRYSHLFRCFRRLKDKTSWLHKA
jgi:glycosyltransferase involved in cell wall biosynthesis